MADYALFLRANFNSGDGNFEENPTPRNATRRFWDEVVVTGGGSVITPQNRIINADTRTMEMTARSVNPTDNVYFAVHFTPAVTLNAISFMCALHPGMRASRATTAAPFRRAGEIQCFLTSSNFKPINVGPTVYQAIGPYALVKDPGGNPGDSCFYKLTLVATGTNAAGVTREFAYDPDMDIEVGN